MAAILELIHAHFLPSVVFVRHEDVFGGVFEHLLESESKTHIHILTYVYY